VRVLKALRCVPVAEDDVIARRGRRLPGAAGRCGTGLDQSGHPAEQDRLADRVAAHAAGADAYLAKPYSPLALLDVVQRLSRG
jgi:hypothetical protein